MLDFEQILKLPSPLQPLVDELFIEKKVEVFVKRDDLIHNEISGNKWRKLKYNILKINDLGKKGVITFGGAFSNHIHAAAAAGKLFGFETIGIIRGDELNENSSKTLNDAARNGMKFCFVSRSHFREFKEIPEVEKLTQKLRELYDFQIEAADYELIPEGGTNDLALKGGLELVSEIVKQLNRKPNFIITAVGSGGTLAGISSNYHSEIQNIGISVLKDGNYIFEEVRNLLYRNGIENFQFKEILDAHCGGYAKINDELINFIRNFEAKHSILLDQVYTGKVFYKFYQLVAENYFPENSTIVILHTGGLQGRMPNL